MPEMMLKISDLHAGYGKIQILSGVNLEAEPDRITAVLGGNGTGKSTLLKAISGLIKPWQGTIEFNGERIDGMRPDKIVRLLSIPSYFTGRRTFFCTACVRPALRRIRRATVPIVPSASLEYVHRASAPGETTNGFDV